MSNDLTSKSPMLKLHKGGIDPNTPLTPEQVARFKDQTCPAGGPETIPLDGQSVEAKAGAKFSGIVAREEKLAEDKGGVAYWCKRANAAESQAVKVQDLARLLCRERDLLRDRLLAMCLAIRQQGFKATDGVVMQGTIKIEDFPPFLDIERFARGAPKEQGIPLREFPMDGKREVKRIKSSDYIMECGHIKVFKPGEKTPKIRERIVCDLCTAMLSERGDLEESK